MTDRKPIACPECGAERPLGTRSMFCSPQHKAAFHNRQTVRGRVLTPLAMAVRQTRGGSRGDFAKLGRALRRQADRMMQKWTDEDRAAGRLTAAAYCDQRARFGVFVRSDFR